MTGQTGACAVPGCKDDWVYPCSVFVKGNLSSSRYGLGIRIEMCISHGMEAEALEVVVKH